ncbi:MAG: ATP-binding protein [Nanopusillaceae archaeon]
MKYFERILLEEIKKWMERKEIIAIKGPRQSGKTTLLKMLTEWFIKEKNVKKENIIFITFEDREVLENFSLNPKEFVKRFVLDEKQRYYFLIDEAHYCDEIGQKLKLLFDIYENIKFTITGSSSLEITSSTSKFLVGRMLSFELFPLNFYEFLNVKDKGLAKIFLERNKMIKNLIQGKEFELPKDEVFTKDFLELFEEYVLFGGYPEIVKSNNEEEKKLLIKNIFNTYLEKDIIIYLHIADTLKFRRCVSLLSNLIGEIIRFESLSTQLKSYYKEITRFIDILEQTYIVKTVKPFYKNLVTELRKNPKIYFVDLGLRNYAINNFNKLENRIDAGKLAENFVFNELKFIDENLNYWRTTAKAEIDFVLNHNILLPIEVKFQEFTKPKITKSLQSFIKNYSPKYALVLTKNFWGERIINDTKVLFVPIFFI